MEGGREGGRGARKKELGGGGIRAEGIFFDSEV